MKVHWPAISWTLRARFGPWILWACVAGLTAFLFVDIGHHGPIIGAARTHTLAVAPVVPARLSAVLVELGQAVQSGDAVALLDAAPVDGRLLVARAERARLTAEIAAQGADTRRELRSEGYKIAKDRADLQAQRTAAAGDALTADAELKAVRSRIATLKPLVADRLTDGQELAALRVRAAGLSKVLSGARAQRNTLSAQLDRLGDEGGTGVPSAPEVGGAEAIATAPLERQIAVVDAEIQAMEAERERLTLRATLSGRISMVHLKVGAVAGPAMPVVTVVGPSRDEIEACVTEPQATDLAVGNIATVWSRDPDAGKAMGRVVLVSPSVAELPIRCRRAPKVPAYGRTAIVKLDVPRDLVPGQVFDVRIDSDPSSASTAPIALGSASSNSTAPAPSPSSEVTSAPSKVPADIHPPSNGGPDASATAEGAPHPTTIRPMTVPSALARRSRLEASGLTWVAERERYLLVSDDTGLKDGRDEHAPWLFAMDRNGTLDPSPVAISGLEEIKDLESIAAGTNGTLYVLSSQSLSRKGKRSLSRQLLLRLSPQGPGYRVTGKVTVASALLRMGPAERRALGIGDTGALDIEGMAVWKGGLLFGLKAPTTATGASIWRLKNPAAAFESGELLDGDLSLWARVPLTVRADGRDVPGGISDLLVAPDGALLLGTTASTGRPRRQDGALVRVPTDGEGVSGPPQTIRVFAGLKPEGIAATPEGSLAVVFDRGAATPTWVQMPWPQAP